MWAGNHSHCHDGNQLLELGSPGSEIPVRIRSTPRMHSSQIPHRRSPPLLLPHILRCILNVAPAGFQRFLAIHRPRPSCIPHLPHSRCRQRNHMHLL
ncbi:hypothetical protein KC19_4G261000 [Ceratodon purpureus]|uniref:Uncharacterized protein n=1 Tax=Ceratodon purpureus TaxID=3225 RepID=A0A8T0IEW5_CERPU|nr:hypothetical protein KC19_4G261000 [Ceratodon purpureus]